MPSRSSCFAPGEPFSSEERLAAELCAAHAALVLRAFAAGGEASSLARPALELAGEALAAAMHEQDTAAEVVRLAARAAGASAAILWESRDGGLASRAAWGIGETFDFTAALAAAGHSLTEAGSVPAQAAERLPRNGLVSTTLQLGRPPLGVLQLLHSEGEEPDAEQLARLSTFGVRAAHALRTGERARLLALELERTRALLEVIAQATAELSVSHTLETAVERVAELLGVDRVAVYLRAEGDGELEEATSRGLAGPHERVADGLLDLALGPSGNRNVLQVSDVVREPRLAAVAAVARETGIDSALAVPLVARGEVVGLLAAYPAGGPDAAEHETALLAALAGQLAVAVQNAQLHEQTTRLAEEREAAFASERAAARRLRALYEVSRSFAQSLSLEETLDTLARTVVDVLDVDAAVVRMPDERREQLVPTRDPRARLAARRGCPCHPRFSLSRSASGACSGCSATSGASGSAAAGRAVPAGTRTVPRARLDGRRRARRPADRGARIARDLLLPARQPALRRDDRGCDRDRRPGCARDRQRAPLPAAEAVRRHDAALAPAARRGRSWRASTWGRCTSRRRASRSAATSTTSSRSTTAGSPSCSAT